MIGAGNRQKTTSLQAWGALRAGLGQQLGTLDMLHRCGCLHTPETAPTAPKAPSPAITLASHSTFPAKVQLDPFPALQISESCEKSDQMYWGQSELHSLLPSASRAGGCRGHDIELLRMLIWPKSGGTHFQDCDGCHHSIQGRASPSESCLSP